MCGICGFTGKNVDQKPVLTAMMNRMIHRGPDGGGQYITDDVALGHRRLSIIDLTETGHQPMFNEDGSLACVFNGEIYNYKALKEQLLAAGHRFTSTS